MKAKRQLQNSLPSLREAARARKRHWPMFQLFKSREEHHEIPQTFGGEPPSEAFTPNPLRAVAARSALYRPRPNGAEVIATQMHAVVLDGKAHCMLHNEQTNESWIGTFDMTLNELAAYVEARRYLLRRLSATNLESRNRNGNV
jgi:hypothetical protein